MRTDSNQHFFKRLFALACLFIGVVLTVISMSSCAHDANPYR